MSKSELKLIKLIKTWIKMDSNTIKIKIFLGIFIQFQKSTISFVMSVCLSICPSVYM
jgi:hypothetical protein